MIPISKYQPNIPKGAIFTITTGDYSDYIVQGVFRASEEIDCSKLVKEWIEAHPGQGKHYHFEPDEFLASLSMILEPIDAYEWHLD